MFKKFSVAEDVSTQTAVKSSVVRGVKKSVTDQFPAIEDYLDDILPKKGDVLEGKGCVHNARLRFQRFMFKHFCRSTPSSLSPPISCWMQKGPLDLPYRRRRTPVLQGSRWAIFADAAIVA